MYNKDYWFMKKGYIKMVNHSKENVYDKYLLKNVQDHARKS